MQLCVPVEQLSRPVQGMARRSDRSATPSPGSVPAHRLLGRFTASELEVVSASRRARRSGQFGRLGSKVGRPHLDKVHP